jgi:FkbM family methyltransferase
MLSTSAKMAIARIVYRVIHGIRSLAGGQDRVRVRRRGVTWELDLREGIDLVIYVLGAFELETLKTLEALTPPGSVVLDIGANVGAHTLHLARLVGEHGRVIAFEPTDFAVSKLRANLAANPSLEPRVEVRQAFLVGKMEEGVERTLASSWPVDGTPPDDPKMGSRSMAVAGAQAVTLDSALEALGRPTVSLVKMDIDGHELGALQGAQSLLARDHPVIVMELAPYVFTPPGKFDEMVRLLIAANYRLRPLGSSEDLPRDPQALRASIPTNGSVNVVAYPVQEASRPRP